VVSYEVAAIAVLVLSTGTVLATLGGAVVLAWDAIERVPPIGLTGLFLTLVAAGNLLVERQCGLHVNRPIFTAIVGPDACRSGALAAVAVVPLVLLATVLATRASTIVRR